MIEVLANSSRWGRQAIQTSIQRGLAICRATGPPEKQRQGRLNPERYGLSVKLTSTTQKWTITSSEPSRISCATGSMMANTGTSQCLGTSSEERANSRPFDGGNGFRQRVGHDHLFSER